MLIATNKLRRLYKANEALRNTNGYLKSFYDDIFHQYTDFGALYVVRLCGRARYGG